MNSPSDTNTSHQGPGAPLRVSVRAVEPFDGKFMFVGEICSGTITTGQKVLCSPSNQASTVAKIMDQPANTEIGEASAPAVAGIILEDGFSIEHGELISDADSLPFETSVFRTRLVWRGDDPLAQGEVVTLRTPSLETKATIEAIVSPAELSPEKEAEVVIRCDEVIAVDPGDSGLPTGRVEIVQEGLVLADGLVELEGYPDQRQIVTRRCLPAPALSLSALLFPPIAKTGSGRGTPRETPSSRSM